LLDTVSQDSPSGNTTALSGTGLSQAPGGAQHGHTVPGTVGAMGTSLASDAVQVSGKVLHAGPSLHLTDASEDQGGNRVGPAGDVLPGGTETTAKIIQPLSSSSCS